MQSLMASQGSLTVVIFLKGHSLSAKAECWTVVKVERKGESLLILSAALRGDISRFCRV